MGRGRVQATSPTMYKKKANAHQRVLAEVRVRCDCGEHGTDDWDAHGVPRLRPNRRWAAVVPRMGKRSRIRSILHAFKVRVNWKSLADETLLASHPAGDSHLLVASDLFLGCSGRLKTILIPYRCLFWDWGARGLRSTRDNDIMCQVSRLWRGFHG